jgi:hypothetical protein
MTLAWQVNARQFVLGPNAVGARNLTELCRIGDEWQLLHHPLLTVQRAERDGTAIVCLGDALDPNRPERDNAAVVQELTGCRTFDQFEAATAGLGGRWLMIVRFGGKWRVYPDATGARSVFVLRHSDGKVWLASQPGLFKEALGTPRDEALQARFDAHKHNAASWPGELTPFVGVTQLLPNHYLDLQSGVAHRFWPTELAPQHEMEHVASEVAGLLHGNIAATLRRGSAAMPLTAGYDSRTLFACARELRGSIPYFRILGHHLPSYDTTIPRKLVKTFGLTIRELAPQHCDKEMWHIMQDNVARMWWDPADYMINTFAAMKVRYVLIGQLSEIARCFYYPNGSYPPAVTPELLNKVAHYDGHPLATEAFARWLQDAPLGIGPHALDLFYWEHRAGNWAAMMSTACDMFIEPIAPYNCRRLLSMAMSLDVAHRRAPYALHRQICRITAPEVLKYPFNFSWRDTISDAIASVIPWRVRMAVNRWRYSDVHASTKWT